MKCKRYVNKHKSFGLCFYRRVEQDHLLGWGFFLDKSISQSLYPFFNPSSYAFEGVLLIIRKWFLKFFKMFLWKNQKQNCVENLGIRHSCKMQKKKYNSNPTIRTCEPGSSTWAPEAAPELSACSGNWSLVVTPPCLSPAVPLWKGLRLLFEGKLSSGSRCLLSQWRMLNCSVTHCFDYFYQFYQLRLLW